jgi:hypothetical protein
MPRRFVNYFARLGKSLPHAGATGDQGPSAARSRSSGQYSSFPLRRPSSKAEMLSSVVVLMPCKASRVKNA